MSETVTAVLAPRRRRSFSTEIAKWGLILALVAAIVVFGALRPESFLTADNLRAVLVQAAAPMILAIGLTIPLAQGDFDLSIGSVLGLGGAVAVSMQALHGMNWIAAVVLALVIAVGVGVVNGVLVAVFNASSFITTLATSTVLLGVEYLFTNQQTLFSNIAPGYAKLGQAAPAWGINVQVWIALGFAIVAWVYLQHTEAGRYTYAIGGNSEAARFAGVPVARYRVIGYMVVALAAAVAGILLTAQAGSSSPNQGVPYLLPAYAAAFLGSTCLKPGVFNVAGTVVASIFLGVIATGLQMLQASTAIINLLQGGILIVAMLVGKIERRNA